MQLDPKFSRIYTHLLQEADLYGNCCPSIKRSHFQFLQFPNVFQLANRLLACAFSSSVPVQTAFLAHC